MLTAQASVHATLGARYTSTLVHDSIVAPLDVRPDLAPMLTGAVDLPLAAPWQLELLADVSTSIVRRHDAGGGTAPITRVWMLGVSVGLRRQLNPWLEGRAAVGGLKYLPAASIGLFSAGTGGVMPYGSVALDAVPAVLARRRLALEAAADVHRFLTPALRNTGFTDARVVYRISVGVRLDLRRGRAP
ncbi:MAG TPA: hypothetical protein VLB49_13890 [Gemmatimonadales bacterium]|nr:hypothetical protein [Gemmatimonadales bacterium]